jgi:hypothetical protein
MLRSDTGPRRTREPGRCAGEFIMSSRNAKLRETMRTKVLSSPDEDRKRVTDWQPDWGRSCEICGQTPCMVGLSGGVVIVEATKCAECLNAGSARLPTGSGY